MTVGNFLYLTWLHPVETCKASKFRLPLVKRQKRGGTDFHGAGDVEDVHGAAAEAGCFSTEAAVGFHEIGPVDLGKMIEATFPTLLEEGDLLIRLIKGNFFPKGFEAERVDEFSFLDFPDGEGEILGNDLVMHGLRAGLADVELQQGTGIEVKHGHQRPSRSAATVSSAVLPPPGIAVAR